ncbi:uncharacterized protein [Centruroides vittatus]|uniref:uncharacterized protein n=1 Tax=Centruroides vittatus TaxID=120091 RepID=UPI003510C910
MSNDKETPLVLVTGASGFISLHIIQLLQKEGYKVRGTVRSLKNEAKVKPIRELCPNAKYQLELVEADLTKDDGWRNAVKDCTYVLHVASPFPNVPPESEDDLIKPAVEGTKRVLRACSHSESVKRVVLTSSIASVHGETTVENGKVYNESDWSDVNSPYLDAYAKSKTLAEKAAWDFVKDLPASKRFELATVNPALVIGPIISGTVSTSTEVIKRLMDGSMPMLPRLNFSLCDVRDVAKAHLKAMIVPEAAGNRHIVASDHLWMRDMANILTEEFSQYNYHISAWNAPYITLWFFSCIDKSTSLILKRIGKKYMYDNKRTKEVLGVQLIDIKKSLIDTIYSMIDNGVLKKTSQYRNKRENSK